MIKKFLIFKRSDGLVNTLKFSFKGLCSLLYTHSVTNFYTKENCDIKFNENKIFSIKRVSSGELEKINFPRLKLLSWRKWLDKGANLYITYDDNKPIGYTWSHFNNYEIHGTGVFCMSDKECWIGPTFVDKDYRGKGANKAQILYQLICENDIQSFYTSVNNKNIASIKSFKRNGFRFMGKLIIIKILGITIYKNLTEELNSRIVK